MRYYLCIDLKSFYASVECVERGLNPLTTNLVVADENRTDKTICLAVTPSLKEYGIKGRARLYEIKQKVNQINIKRKAKIKKNFIAKSFDKNELIKNDNLKLDFIIAEPRMKHYIDYSTKIYGIYLKYLAPEDIHVYSIDEVFCDITDYINMYKKTPKEIAAMIINDVYKSTGITGVAGIGTNMYLAKISMDIVAKHMPPNEYGVRIAVLDEKTYRKNLWNHRPLTDFWRIGNGIAKKLEKNGMYTMGDIAEKSLKDENLLYKLFGINAELLIDHAWGYEPCTMKDVKNYKPESTSMSKGQVLHEPYNFENTKLIVKEMIELLTLDMVSKNLVTDQVVLTVGYDIENLNKNNYTGEIIKDYYGRKVPKPAHGTIRLNYQTSSTKTITKELVKLYDKIVNPNLLVRRINIAVCNLEKENKVAVKNNFYQYNLFSNIEDEIKKEEKNIKDEQNEKKIQLAILKLKNKYCKNAILKGMNLEEKATTIERNNEIGGHKG